MKIILQRVSSASVTVNEKQISSIGLGYVLLLGIEKGDTQTQVDLLVDKITHLRVMSDQNGKMNCSILDSKGEILVVSQFTLLADLTNGRRPSFTNALEPNQAESLYEYFIDQLKKKGISNVATGIFGAYMKVHIINDGPVTIILQSSDLS